MICQDCGQTFADKRKLAVHSQNLTKEEIKCHICEKICIGNKKFLNHIKLHRTFECENCGETVKLNSKTSHGKKCKGDNTVFNNTRKTGFIPPSMFKMRKSSPYVMSRITNKDI